MKLWAWLQCLTGGHRPQKFAEAKSGVEVVILYRCKRCGRVTETRYRTDEKHISDRGDEAANSLLRRGR